MSRIWEFTGETKVELGVNLKRIRLAVDCQRGKKGDLGGWIEKAENLIGNAWVSGDARVSGNAQETGVVKHLIGGQWSVTCLSNGVINIGCKSYKAIEWKKFSNRQISEMSDVALEFWKKYKTIIFELSKIAVADGKKHKKVK